MTPSHLKALESDGFTLEQGYPASGDFAHLSLNIALRSYYATYKDVQMALPRLTSAGPLDDTRYSLRYIEHAAECILHFQHFAELICRAVLRGENALLAVDAARDAVVLHKLLRGETISTEDEQALKWSEFSAILSSLEALTRADRLRKGAFLAKHIPMLRAINRLRNRLWHRGAFVIHYRALDVLVAGHVLPFVRETLEQAEFSALRGSRTRLPARCGIDPLIAIATSQERMEHNHRRIAVLKEIGRAMYANPLQADGLFDESNDVESRHAAQRADARANASGNVAGVIECPVCGLRTLVGDQNYADHFDQQLGEDVPGERFVFQVECQCCSFSLWDSDIGSIAELELSLPNYWSPDTWS